MSECKCNYHLGMGPNLKCPKHGDKNWKQITGKDSTYSDSTESAPSAGYTSVRKGTANIN